MLEWLYSVWIIITVILILEHYIIFFNQLPYFYTAKYKNIKCWEIRFK